MFLFFSGGLLMFDYAQLVSEPNVICKEIARASGINPDFYNEFNYSVYNRTVSPKSKVLAKAYSGLAKVLRENLPRSGRLFLFLSQIKPYVDKFYERYNSRNNELEISDQARSEIVELTRKEAGALRGLGVDVCWGSNDVEDGA